MLVVSLETRTAPRVVGPNGAAGIWASVLSQSPSHREKSRATEVPRLVILPT